MGSLLMFPRMHVNMKKFNNNYRECNRRPCLYIGVYVGPINYTLKTELLKITLEASFLTLPKSAMRDNTVRV